ncbi:hypothetical protein Efla_001525 [Eimeria flavescens]
MIWSSDMRPPAFHERGPPPRVRGGPRGASSSVRGNGPCGFRGGWRSSGGPYGRPGESSFRGDYVGIRRGQPARKLLGGKPAVCSICQVGEGRYKFRCCSRPFCSTACYKKHTERPCGGPQKQDQLQKAVPDQLDVAASEAVHAELSECAGGPAVDSALLGLASDITGGLQEYPPIAANSEAPGSPLSSSDSETESGEASSEESDFSPGDPATQWSSSQPQGRNLGGFDALTPTEQERIKQLASQPEMQSVALREAIRSLVAAASQSLGRGSAALSFLMRRPDFACFIDLLMEAFDSQADEPEQVMQPPKVRPSLRRRYLGEAGLRPN